MMYISFLCLSMIQLTGCNSTVARLNLGNSGESTINNHTYTRPPVIVPNPNYSNQTDENEKNVNETYLSNSYPLGGYGFRPVFPTRQEVTGQAVKDDYLHPQNPNPATSLSRDECIAIEALLQLSKGIY